MRKSVIWIALLCLIFLAGCASELAFVKSNHIYKIKDDGTNLSRVNIPGSNWYFRPDVSNDGKDLAFVSAPPTGPGVQIGTICRVKLDGSGFFALTPTGTSRHDAEVVSQRSIRRLLSRRGNQSRNLPNNEQRGESHPHLQHGGQLRRRP